MMSFTSMQLIKSSSRMTYTLTARSLCSRSLATATIASQSSSLLIQSDLSRLLPIQASARTFSTTPTCLRNPSNKVRLPKRIISDPSEVDESHLDKPTDKEGKAANPITNEYSTLKPYMNYDTWKALTGKPFNFKEMSEVQERVLSLLPDLADPFNDTPMPDNQGGRDLLVKAKTGTGKTVAFLVPAIERRLRAARQVLKGNYTGPFAKMLAKEKPELYEATDLDKQTKVSIWRNFHANTAGVLVLSPTRELATQIATEAEKLTMHQKNFGVQLLVGGASRSIQVRTWSRTRPDIVVATPGRLLDLLNEEPMVSKALSAVQTLIYDEADTLLDMGFRDDLEKILQFLPKKEDRSTMLFSATVSSDIREIARKSLGSDHRFIDCVPAGESNVHEHIPQFATVVRDGKEQLEQLTRLIAIDQLRNPGKSKIVVFAPTTKMVQLYADLFNFSQGLVNSLPAGRNTASYELHSRKDSSQRFRISSSFRNDKRGASILFTSDVSARGVDYPGTTRVINLGISGTTDQYIHRIGRTGRAGAQGRADIILQGFEAGFLEASLNKLPIKVETVDETKAQLAKLCEDFDRDPESIVDPEIWKIMNDPTLRPRWSKEGSNSTQYIARFISPMSERLSDDILKAKAESAKSSADPAEVEGVFMSNLGFYIPKAYAMDTTANNVIEGLKEWAMSLAELPREPYVSPATLAKMGVSTGNRRTSDRFGRSSSRFGGSMSGSGRFDRGDSGRDRSDRGYSGRDRFDRGGSGRDRFDRGDGRRGRSPGKYNFDGHSREGPSYGRRSSERFF